MSTTDFIESVKSFIPYSLLFILPLLIALSPINPVEAAQQFNVYRMHQFDLHGIKFGGRSVAFNFEVTSLTRNTRGALTRKCLLLHLYEVTVEVLRQAAQQHVGGLLILLPQKWTPETRQHLLALESELLSQYQEDNHLAIYFAYEDESMQQLYADAKYTTEAGKSTSAAAALFKSFLSTGYQLILPTSASVNTGQPLADFELVNIQGKLPGLGLEEALPTIVIVAHYDAGGVAPGLSFGYDSNGSGVIALLEMARYLSLMYSQQATQPKYNIVFLLSSGGKLNYLGTKRWLEEHLDVSGPTSNGMDSGPTDSSTNSGDDASEEEPSNVRTSANTGTARHMSGPGLLNNVALVICLEALAWGDAGSVASESMPSSLHLHVSKPPRNDSVGHQFVQYLNWAYNKWSIDPTDAVNNHSAVNLVHKKINLKEDFLAWEHERFSLSKLPGITLSRFSSYQATLRHSILDDGTPLTFTGDASSLAEVQAKWLLSLRESIQVTTEALMQLLYAGYSSDASALQPLLEEDTFAVNSLHSLLNFLSRQTRSAVLLPKNHLLLTGLEQILTNHLGTQNVRVNRMLADKRDPEFVLYDHLHPMIMEAHKVKPAVFEFLLAVSILAYLAAFFFVAQYFDRMCELLNVVLQGSSQSSLNGKRVKAVSS